MAKVSVEIAEPLPNGFIPVESALVMKCLDDQGIPTLIVRNSRGLAVWDAMGMFQVALDVARSEARQSFISLHQDDDED